MAERPPVAERCAAEFAAQMGGEPAWVSWAPGRINLIGGHTDYNQGLALPAAINRWISVALRPRSDGVVRVRSLDHGEEVVGAIDGFGEPLSSWQRFVAGSVTLFGRHHPLPSGFDAVFGGDVPEGAGLSSSAALTIAWMTVLRAWTGAEVEDLRLARYAQRVEHEFLGVKCGLLDPIGSLMARLGQVLLVDFQDLSVTPVEVALENVNWVVLHSGVCRALSDSPYLDRVRECAKGLDAIRRAHPSVQHLREVRLSMVEGEDVHARRLRHVVTENRRVQRAVESVATGDAAALGHLLLESHSSLRDDYQVSCSQLDLLVELASEHPGCFGARMVGGGFGGCTLNLVRSYDTPAFIETVLSGYRARVEEVPRSFTFDLVSGASVG